MKRRERSESRIRTLFVRAAAVAALVLPFAAHAEPDTFGLGDSSDGACTNPAAGSIVNTYGLVTTNLYFGMSRIKVGAVSTGAGCGGGAFGNSQLIMVLEMQGATATSGDTTAVNLANSKTARFEFAETTALNGFAGGYLNLRAPLDHNFDGNVTQVIRVRQFTTVALGGNTNTITAPAWNATAGVGGVVAFLASGAVTIGGNNAGIFVNALGFRGGSLINDPLNRGCVQLDSTTAAGLGGMKGEGIVGGIYNTGATASSRGNYANAAGGGDCHNSGGGGGGNGGVGGPGGITSTVDTPPGRAVGGIGGANLTLSLLNHLPLGGGGGAGEENDGHGSAGGRGGGIVFIRGASLSMTGTNARISANGETPALPGCGGGNCDGAGGGGAGGSVYVRVTGTLTCSVGGARGIFVNGGDGSDVNDSGAVIYGPGGGGGGGQLLFQGTTASCPTQTNSGVGGQTNGGTGPANGAGPTVVNAGGTGGQSTQPPGSMTIPVAPTLVNPPNGNTSNPSPLITGTAATAGATINIYVDGLLIGTTTATASGSYTFQPTFTFKLGSHTIYTTAVLNGIETASPTHTINETNAATTWASITSMNAEPEADGARISWQTDLEVDNAGFRLLRTDEGGNEEDIAWIPAAGSFSNYAIVDAPLAAGFHEWWIEDVDYAGLATRHGPLFLTTDAPAAGLADAGTIHSGRAIDSRWADPADAGDVRILSRDESGITYEIIPPPYSWSPVTEGTLTRYRIRIDGYATTGVPGLPELPTRSIRVPVPAGRGGDVRLLSIEETAQDWLIPTLAPGDVTGAPASLVPAGATLGYPRHASRADAGPAVSLVDRGAMGVDRVVSLVVTPLRWDPATNSTRVASRLVARVDFKDIAATTLPAETAAERTQRRVLGAASLVVRVASRGLVRVPAPAIVAAGLGPASGVAVYRDGAAIPSFFDGSSVLFLADVRPTPFSATTAYFLAPRAAGEAPVVLAPGAAAPAPGAAADLSDRISSFEEDHLFALLAQAGKGADRWYWTELISGAVESASVPFTLPVSADPSSAATLSIRFQGEYDDPASILEHVVRVQINGVDAGVVSLAAFERRTFALPVPAGTLVAGTNTLSLTNQSTGASRVALDAFTLSFRAVADAAGATSLAVRARTTAALTAGGFQEPVAWALDETDAAAPLLLPVANAQAADGSWLASVQATAGHDVRFVTPSDPAPAAIARAPVDVLGAVVGADYLVIAAHDLAPNAAALASYRASAAGGSFRTAAFDANDLYDTFGFGDSSPAAIRRFLERASTDWVAPAPRYLALVGSSTYDPLDHLGLGVAGMLPSERVDTAILSAASDTALVTLGSADALPDLSVGRIPARTAQEVDTAVARIQAYESASRNGWDRRATILSDDDLGDFDLTAARTAGIVPATLHADSIRSSAVGASGATEALRDQIAAGASMVTYIGHGSVQTWGAEPFLDVGAAASLANERLPLVFAADCLNAFDHPSAESLGVALVRRPGASGGASAVWTSTAITPLAGHEEMLLAIQHSIWREPGRRLGDAAASAYAAISWREDAPDLIGSFEILGDPALRPNVNEAPRARARLVSRASGVALVSADGSTDADADALDYRWTILEAPAGGRAQLAGAASRDAVLSGPAGHYRLRLEVADPVVAGPPTELAIDLDGGSSARSACAVGPGTGERGWLAFLLGAMAIGLVRRGQRRRLVK